MTGIGIDDSASFSWMHAASQIRIDPRLLYNIKHLTTL